MNRKQHKNLVALFVIPIKARNIELFGKPCFEYFTSVVKDEENIHRFREKYRSIDRLIAVMRKTDDPIFREVLCFLES